MTSEIIYSSRNVCETGFKDILFSVRLYHYWLSPM